MTDNQGAWTLGCYGNRDIRTPHIDRLAAEGMLFTRAFSSNAVCSPTRATYLTGLLPSQHGVHCYLRANEAQMGPNAYSTIAEFRTLPNILAEAGYRCGLVGKWHLGNNLHPQEGFTEWITMPHGATGTFYNAEVIEHGEVRKEPQYLTDLWTEHGVRFIEQNADRPFFLFLSYNGPYGLGGSLFKPAQNRHAAYYADKPLHSFPREEVHPWLYNNKPYINNIRAIRRVAAEVSGVDDGVGRIMQTLKQHNLDRNTLVIFTADQGWAGGQHGLWGMGDHTRPLCAFDPTMHIPLIVRQPGSIPQGRKTDVMVSNYDLFPTLLHYLGLEEQIPRRPERPGRNYTPVLKGRPTKWDNVVYYEFENTRAIRTAEWKFVERYPDGPHELYDLKKDPGEQFNLFGQPLQQEIQSTLRKRLHGCFTRYADPKYDLWQGGGSKTRLLTAEAFRKPGSKGADATEKRSPVAGVERSEPPRKPAGGSAALRPQPPPSRQRSDVEVTLKKADWNGVQTLVKQHKGQVVVVDVWTTTCPACLKEFPEFAKFKHDYADRVALVSVACDYDGIEGKPPEFYRDDVFTFLKQQQAAFDNVLLTVPLLNFLEMIDLGSTPAVLVYDRQGRLVRRFDNDDADSAADEFTMQQVRRQIDRLLQPAPGRPRPPM